MPGFLPRRLIVICTCGAGAAAIAAFPGGPFAQTADPKPVDAPNSAKPNPLGEMSLARRTRRSRLFNTRP